MTRNSVVSQADWLEARRALLAKEKALKHEQDALARERQQLPWVRVGTEYIIRCAGRKGGVGRSLWREEPADDLSLHVRAGVGSGMPFVLDGGGYDECELCASDTARRGVCDGFAGADGEDCRIQEEAGMEYAVGLVVSLRV